MKSRIELFDGGLERLVGSETLPIVGPKLIGEAPAWPPSLPAPSAVGTAITAQRLTEFDLQYDSDERLLWCYFDYTGRPCFTSTVLEEAQRIQRLARTLGEEAPEEGLIRYLVLGSRAQGIWNLGGDLELFAELIRCGDRAALARYAQACCDVGYTNATLMASGMPIITVALVQGDALGGGFEAALSSNIIVAERGARFGLPEVLFNLFPGMGAYTFLSRRIAPGIAERMILSGEIFTAEKLYELGVVDVLTAEGQGVDGVYDCVGRSGRRHATHAALRQARRIAHPVTFEEMTRIADLWVDAALKLTDADLRKMVRLALAQDRRRRRQSAAL